MKKIFFLPFFTLSFCCFLFQGCKKSKPNNVSLPEASQEGKNTLGFKLDGEIWIPYAKCKNFGNPCKEAEYQGLVLPNVRSPEISFAATNENGSKSSFISLSSWIKITKPGNYIDSMTISFRMKAVILLAYPTNLPQKDIILQLPRLTLWEI